MPGLSPPLRNQGRTPQRKAGGPIRQALPYKTELVACGAGGFEGEAYCLRILRADGHLLIYYAVLFLPGFYCVRAWGQSLQLEFAVFCGYCEEWVFEDCYVALHPWVDVAFYRDGYFLAGEGFIQWRGAWGLRLVPFAIVFGRRVNIVSRLIVVLYFDGLAGHQGHY